jgi:hypothetical protein
VTLDLEKLREHHPLLPQAVAASLAHCGALALQRRHTTPANLQASLWGKERTFVLAWRACPPDDAEQVDSKRATECGAEAVALVLCGVALGWSVVRRIQSSSAGKADWQMTDGESELVLEVSGTDHGKLESRLRDKLDQAAQSDSGRIAACVVRFQEPRALLEGVA